MKTTLIYVIAMLAIGMLLLTGCTADKNAAAPANESAPGQNATASGGELASGPTATPPSGQQQPPSQGKISAQELSAHSTADDCWIVYNGEVYDISSFVPIHPGGPSRIIPHCGKTTLQEAATAKHGANKIAQFMLKSVKVGTFLG